jgi:hypothetical protein
MMVGIKLETNDDGDMAYVYLPNHPGKGVAGVIVKQISLHALIDNYQGPEVFLDFDKNDVMIGMELFLD